ncbi:hypothetical protein FRC0431_01842 [Corynebacterium diphtheriae]|nr:hypothetical protein FRC0431_01842 [Corynebacterium diphtheriae]
MGGAKSANLYTRRLNMSNQDYTGVRVEGARKLRSTLKKAGIDVREDMKQAHKDAASIVSRRAAQIAPVGPGSRRHKPGQLKASVRPAGTQTAAIVRAGKKRVPYAGPIQWGWHKRKIKPTFFLTRAASDTEPAWLKGYEKKFNQILDSIEGK